MRCVGAWGWGTGRGTSKGLNVSEKGCKRVPPPRGRDDLSAKGPGIPSCLFSGPRQVVPGGWAAHLLEEALLCEAWRTHPFPTWDVGTEGDLR